MQVEGFRSVSHSTNPNSLSYSCWASLSNSFALRLSLRARMRRLVCSRSLSFICGQFLIRDMVPSSLMTMGPRSASGEATRGVAPSPLNCVSRTSVWSSTVFSQGDCSSSVPTMARDADILCKRRSAVAIGQLLHKIHGQRMVGGGSAEACVPTSCANSHSKHRNARRENGYRGDELSGINGRK